MNYSAESLPRTHYRQAHTGFTLIELMIAVVVVGILATIAYPSFVEQVRKSRRADAMTEINKVVQAQERYRANNTSYGTHFIVSGGRFAGVGIATDSGAATTYTGTSGYYSMTMPASGTTSYTVTATAGGSQASDSKCTTLSVALSGGNLAYTSTGSATANQCWNR